MSDNTNSILNNTISIPDPADPNITYEFRVPSIKEQMALGMKARAIRRENDPTGSGDLNGLDSDTAMLSWALGAFEILLTASGAKWPFSEGPDKRPIVRYAKFPDDKLDTVLYVGYKLDTEIARFRKGWTSNWKPPVEEAVDGVSDSRAQESVQG